MVVAYIVGFKPAEPESAARTPVEVRDAAAPVGYPTGIVAIDGGGAAGCYGRGPVKITHGASPATHRREAGSIAVLQLHRLGAAVAAITPLLACEVDVEACKCSARFVR